MNYVVLGLLRRWSVEAEVVGAGVIPGMSCGLAEWKTGVPGREERFRELTQLCVSVPKVCPTGEMCSCLAKVGVGYSTIALAWAVQKSTIALACPRCSEIIPSV